MSPLIIFSKPEYAYSFWVYERKLVEITLLKTIDGHGNETFQIENNMTTGQRRVRLWRGSRPRQYNTNVFPPLPPTVNASR